MANSRLLISGLKQLVRKMSPEQWLSTSNPAAMLRLLDPNNARVWRRDLPDPTPSERKLRLFACAAWRHMRHEKYPDLDGGPDFAFVEAAEGMADGRPLEAQYFRGEIGWFAHWTDAGAAARHVVSLYGKDSPAFASLLRDIVNPFADRTWLIHQCPRCAQEGSWNWRGSVDASGKSGSIGQWPWCPKCGVEMNHRLNIWLAWNGGMVRKLAEAAYGERLPFGLLDANRLAVLADCLEDAGATDAAILEHLRSGGVHVRGCWCLDILLGRL
jgi:hypothetical protein